MIKKVFDLYVNIIILGLLAIPIGIAVGIMTAVFGRTLLWLTDVRVTYAYQLIPFLGVIGALMAWCTKRFGGKSSKGMALIFEAGHHMTDDIPLRLIPFTIIGTWLTHLFGGSAGREGVAIQIGGTLAHGIGKHLPMEDSGKLLLMTGMAAGFAGLFRTPIAAAFFAIEILTAGILEHRVIFPSLVAAFTASFTSGYLGLEKFSVALSDQITLSWPLVFQLLTMGILFGITGGLFSLSLYKIKQFLAQRLQNPVLRMLIIGLVVSGFSLLCWGGRYSGLGTNLISMSFAGGVLTWDFALKFVFTAVTISAGFQGGEVTPLFAIGATLGVVLSSHLGVPAAFAAALGYAAVFGSATNTLIAPMLIGAEVFGYAYMPYFAVVCAIAYVCNGNFCIYPLQKGRWIDNI